MAERVGTRQRGTERKPHRGTSEIKKGNDSTSRVSPVDKILHLQRTIGNRAVTRLIEAGTLQANLNVGSPDDIYEKEADRVADRVMRMAVPETDCPECTKEVGVQRQEESEEEELQTSPVSEQITPLVQRVPEPEEDESLRTKLIRRQTAEEEEEIHTRVQRQAEEEEEPVQAKAVAGRIITVTSDLESGIPSLKGGGQPLSPPSRDFFESRFGVDFSRVRIHTGSKAARIARSINARAFTTGRDVVFGAGQYSPGTCAGKKLLAHELTHVVQQNGPGKAGPRVQKWPNPQVVHAAPPGVVMKTGCKCRPDFKLLPMSGTARLNAGKRKGYLPYFCVKRTKLKIRFKGIWRQLAPTRRKPNPNNPHFDFIVRGSGPRNTCGDTVTKNNNIPGREYIFSISHAEPGGYVGYAKINTAQTNRALDVSYHVTES